MSKSRGIKAASLFVGVLLCMVLVQTAFAQPESNETIQNATIQNATIQNATIQNAVANIIDPQSYYTGLTAGSATQFTVSFTNEGSEALVLTPKAVAVPNSGKNIDESWITISPANTTVAPGSVQKFNIDLNAPGDAESGEYQTIIAFTDDFLPTSTQFANSMNLQLSVQALPKIQLETQYISDTIDAGKEYEYKIKIKNVASKDVTIDPKIPVNSNYYDPTYIPAFNSDAIGISAPSIIKAGETANMTIKVKVPKNVTGRYYGNILMNVDGEVTPNYMNTPQMNLDFTVFKQPLVPYAKTFKTVNKKPITIEVSTDTSDNPWLQSPKKEKPSFELKLKRNKKPVNMNFVKSIESGSVSIGGGYSSTWDDNYQNYGTRYVETYTAPGAVGNWELSVLPKNTQNFGYSITVGDSDNSKLKN